MQRAFWDQMLAKSIQGISNANAHATMPEVFGTKEQNSSKGIYVMHRRRLAKPPCLRGPKQHRN